MGRRPVSPRSYAMPGYMSTTARTVSSSTYNPQSTDYTPTIITSTSNGTDRAVYTPSRSGSLSSRPDTNHGRSLPRQGNFNSHAAAGIAPTSYRGTAPELITSSQRPLNSRMNPSPSQFPSNRSNNQPHQPRQHVPTSSRSRPYPVGEWRAEMERPSRVNAALGNADRLFPSGQTQKQHDGTYVQRSERSLHQRNKNDQNWDVSQTGTWQ